MEKQPAPSGKDQENLKLLQMPRRVRFGRFEVDLRERELRRSGVRVNVQQKPFQVLELLIAHAGELVSRSRLARYLWPDLHVDYDGSLNTAVNALRQALNDSPQGSRFIETRPGLGYRFIAEVVVLDAPQTADAVPGNPEQLAESVMAAVAGALHLSRNSKSSWSGALGPAAREAHADYQRGKYLLERINDGDLLRAKAYLEAALEGGQTLACSALADVYCLGAALGISPAPQAYSRAKELAVRGLRLHQDEAEAHAALGFVKNLFEWDWEGAEADFRQALRLDPYSAYSHQLYAGLLASTGRAPEALGEARRAQDAEPLSFRTNLQAAWVLLLTGEFEGAASQAWKVLALEPRQPYAQYLLGLAYEQMNLFDEAITEFQNSQACAGNYAVITSALVHACALAGDTDRAQQKMRELDELSARQFVPPFLRSVALIALGAAGESLDALEKAYQQHDVSLVWLGADPRLAPLRQEPRFKALVHQVFENARPVPEGRSAPVVQTPPADNEG